jgi:hypothetical protein
LPDLSEIKTRALEKPRQFMCLLQLMLRFAYSYPVSKNLVLRADNGRVPRSHLPVRERRMEAAVRLCHDLGKAVRWLAPATPESSERALRQRLEDDLLRTRRGEEGTIGAIEIFDAWRKAQGVLFEGEALWRSHLDAIARAIDVMRERLPRLAILDAAGLSALDEASRVVSQETRALRDAVSCEQPSPGG